MPFEAMKFNAEITEKDFNKNGCQSVHNETGEKCGCKTGYQLLTSANLIVFQCSNCGISNKIIPGGEENHESKDSKTNTEEK